MRGSTEKNGRQGITHLRVRFSPTAYLGPGRADLLEGILETQSIAAAGKRLGMSYKRAWGLVQALNEGFDTPLVVTQRGGRDQGGAHLTKYGQACLDGYRRMQILADSAIADEFARLAGQGASLKPNSD